MRLTGPLDAAGREKAAQLLWPLLENVCVEGIAVDAVALFGDPGDGQPLSLIQRFPLGG